MEGLTVQVEVERIMNLVGGFGWRKVKEELPGDEIHVELVKKDSAAIAAGHEKEVERVMNLVTGFGWEKMKEELVDGELHLVIKKKSGAAAVAAPPPGPS